MLYSILSQSVLHETTLNALRMVLSGITALAITFFGYPAFIKKLSVMSFGQEVRNDGPQSHLKKKGTPTMGGLLLLFAVIAACSLWGNVSNFGLFSVLIIMIGYGFIGFIDDYRKVKKSNTKGLSPKGKLLGQITIGLIALVIYASNSSSFPFLATLNFPGLFTWSLPLWLYLPFALFIIVGTSNGSNLTDGLDGLAIVPTIFSACAFLIIILCTGEPHMVELGIFCCALIGASIGFLWYNAHPATIFMGDVGSLSLGGSLAMLAILTHNELISAVLHGIFLVEVLSVMTQVASFKLTQKRIFKMAPLHHHFELSGWPEPKVIVRFWILAGLLAITTVLMKVWP